MNSTQVLLKSINEFIDYTTEYLQRIPEVVVEGRIKQTIDQLQRQRWTRLVLSLSKKHLIQPFTVGSNVFLVVANQRWRN